MKFVTDLSKGILGSPDSPELWSEIISHIPDEVLLKPGVRILNVACGHCTEAVIIAKRMIALGISKEEVNKSIWLIDKYRVFTRYAKKTYGFQNVVTTDFLTWETDMKFDCVIGNPPYQGSTESESGKNWQPLWPKFLKAAFDLVIDDGYVALVTPRTWASGSRNTTSAYFKEKKIVYLNMNVTKYFDIEGDVSAYILKNQPALDESVDIIDVLGEITRVDMKKFNYLPFNMSRVGLSIFEKTVLPSEHYAFVESKKQISIATGPKIVFLAGRNGSYLGRLFVEFNDIPRTGIGQIAKIDLASEDEACQLMQTLKLKMYQFLFDLLGGNRGLNRTWILNSMPRLENKLWTDAEIYEHFNLTQEEIDYIEANVK